MIGDDRDGVAVEEPVRPPAASTISPSASARPRRDHVAAAVLRGVRLVEVEEEEVEAVPGDQPAADVPAVTVDDPPQLRGAPVWSEQNSSPKK